MSEFNYEKVAKEIGWSFDKVNYTCVQDVDFNYYEQVKNHIKNKTITAVGERNTEDLRIGDHGKDRLFFNAGNLFCCHGTLEFIRRKDDFHETTSLENSGISSLIRSLNHFSASFCQPVTGIPGR